MYLLVIGYYDKGNLGDEAYKEIMGQFFPGDILDFILSDKISTVNVNLYDAIIVGGGDLINDYFNQKISLALQQFKGPKIAFSIGIPFPSLITAQYLGHFDHVFVRNYEDLRAIQKVIGAHRAHFTPDIALALKAKSPSNLNDRRVSEHGEKRCGIFVVGNLIRYPAIVAELAHLVSKIALTYKIILYCFNPREDQLLAQAIQEAARQRLLRSNPPDSSAPSDSSAPGGESGGLQRIQMLLKRARDPERITINTTVTSAAAMIGQIRTLDFGVCMRYHAHIFCAVANTPFISISSTRKTRSLMAQAGLQAYQYEIPLDGYYNPTTINYKELREVCRLGLKNRRDLRNQLQIFMSQSRFLLSNLQAARLIRYQKLDIRNQVVDFLAETSDSWNAARLLSAYVLGYPDSPYVWGISQKLTAPLAIPLDTVHQSVKYLLRQGATHSRSYSEIKDSMDPILPFQVDLREYQSYREAHRGGWYLACEAMAARNSSGGIICDLYLDRTFHWARNYFRHTGIIPYTGPWCGVIHHTQDTTYSNHNAATLFEVPEFIRSLHTCLALICLSPHLGAYLRQRLQEISPHVKLVVLDHPILTPPLLFSMTAFHQNPKPMLIQVGAWMRNPFTLYRIPHLQIQKAILIGKEMNGLIPPANFKIAGPLSRRAARRQSQQALGAHREVVTLPCRSSESIPRWIKMVWSWLESTGIKVQSYQDGTLHLAEPGSAEVLNATFAQWIAEVKIIQYQPDQAYDHLLSQNIIFLDLVEAAGVNTVIEAIVRQTPILINDHPGTRALLGDDYPLYYTDLNQISTLIEPEQLQAAVTYLASMDRTRYELSTFLDKIAALGSELETKNLHTDLSLQ